MMMTFNDNSQKYYLGTHDIASENIQVGDLLWLKDNEMIPADCVIMKILN